MVEEVAEDRENPLRRPIRRPGIERDVVSCVNEIVSFLLPSTPFIRALSKERERAIGGRTVLYEGLRKDK